MHHYPLILLINCWLPIKCLGHQLCCDMLRCLLANETMILSVIDWLIDWFLYVSIFKDFKQQLWIRTSAKFSNNKWLKNHTTLITLFCFQQLYTVGCCSFPSNLFKVSSPSSNKHYCSLKWAIVSVHTWNAFRTSLWRWKRNNCNSELDWWATKP